jgi:hypothetical protein
MNCYTKGLLIDALVLAAVLAALPYLAAMLYVLAGLN